MWTRIYLQLEYKPLFELMFLKNLLKKIYLVACFMLKCITVLE